jgi:hypothetical protein
MYIKLALKTQSDFCIKLMTAVKEKICLSEVDKSFLIFHPKLVESNYFQKMISLIL